LVVEVERTMLGISTVQGTGQDTHRRFEVFPGMRREGWDKVVVEIGKCHDEGLSRIFFGAH
jgi:hypothetical protein